MEPDSTSTGHDGAPERAAKRRVLFLCTANAARSQMAEGLTRHLLPDLWEPASAGTAPGTLHPLAVVAMREIGIDISGQWSKGMDEVGSNYDLAITLCAGAAETCPFFAGATRTLHLGLDDPAAAPGTDDDRLAAFRRVRDQMRGELLPFLRRYDLS